MSIYNSQFSLENHRNSNVLSFMRILHIINGELYSGAERVQDILAQRLPELGFEVHLACIKPHLFPGKCRCSKDLVHTFPMRSRFDFVKALDIGRFIRDRGMKLVHSHTPRAALVGRISSLLAGVPMVHHVHSPTQRDSDQILRNVVNMLSERLSISGIRQLITVSRSLAEHFVGHGFSRNMVTVVPNGVTTLGILPNRPKPIVPWVIGVVALFRPRKGLEMLIRAASIVSREHSIRLLLVGPFETENYKRRIRKLASELLIDTFVEWIGFTDDVNAQLRRMDIFVLPSLFGEGMPMVILEAMAAGVPVVATNVEGVPEVISSRDVGRIVPPGSPEALSAAIMAILADETDWVKIRENAYKRQQKFFSDRSMAMRVAQVYRKVLEQ